MWWLDTFLKSKSALALHSVGRYHSLHSTSTNIDHVIFTSCSFSVHEIWICSGLENDALAPENKHNKISRRNIFLKYL
ncbi:unnamed protein product [Blepharisma stoltei]|uniref:Uncharacterized protein n=1 Tax=Blepharisma stoltei TaxID=1481888 RepID=A0AAU9JAB3_9CILI|nr:unnamed protein product [Blepharisma stoltei]